MLIQLADGKTIEPGKGRRINIKTFEAYLQSKSY